MIAQHSSRWRSHGLTPISGAEGFVAGKPATVPEALASSAIGIVKLLNVKSYRIENRIDTYFGDWNVLAELFTIRVYGWELY